MIQNLVLGKMQAALRTAQFTLPDQSPAVYGSSLSDGNRHEHLDLPALPAAVPGKIHGGRQIRYRKAPMTNLFLTMLDRVGARPEKIGDNTGQIEHLTDLLAR